MISLLLKLLIAHLTGDFVFQPDQWVKEKRRKKHKSRYLYLHLLIHTLALIVVLKFDWNYWPALLVIVPSHFIIDLLKLHLHKKINSRLLFALDQGAHLLVILGVVYFYEPYPINLLPLYSVESLILILSLICLTSVASILMKLIMNRWKLEQEDASDSLVQAGKYIGILERLFVFAFILLNQWPAIGWLIAAKSVFRFGDLSRAKDRKLTEYILIGTLLSFGMAISIGLIARHVLQSW